MHVALQQEKSEISMLSKLDFGPKFLSACLVPSSALFLFGVTSDALETTSFSDSLTKFVRTIVSEEIRTLSSTISDQGKKIDAILAIVSSGPRSVAVHADDANADEKITVSGLPPPVIAHTTTTKAPLHQKSTRCPLAQKHELDCKPSSPLSDNEISKNTSLKRHKSTTKSRSYKATSSIKKKISTRRDFKLQRGRLWLYESHDLVNMYGDEMPMILVPNEHCCGIREALMTLCPKDRVGDNVMKEVLNLVASMLTKHAAVTVEGNKWFFPTTFVQIVLQQRGISVGTMEYIKINFMSKVEDLYKIYIPINVKDHWFLVVVEKSRGLITYLDSLKCSK
ncbi:hypothetical protein Ahy_B09g099222 [Arachis hypogaea]|uniref:Ubiquitin-like protease family profile domain-containing protein n=1 Tax=Arachis hypogaea TaxID=3818 RepID=A0A444XU49_ARAHY|nr:hypothetical protein Ahy_B09g099222 [Arachis hypogaea]